VSLSLSGALPLPSAHILKAHDARHTIPFNIKSPVLLEVFAFNSSVPLRIPFPGRGQVLQGTSKNNFQQ